MVGFNHENEVKYKDFDSDGNLIDSISYELLDKEDCIEINGRFFNRETVLGIMNTNQQDPFNTDKPLTSLMVNGVKENPIIKNNGLAYFFFGLAILFGVILLISVSIYVLHLGAIGKRVDIINKIIVICWAFLFIATIFFIPMYTFFYIRPTLWNLLIMTIIFFIFVLCFTEFVAMLK